MPEDRDFRVLGEKPASLPRKLLSGFLIAIKWLFLIGLGLYLAFTALNHTWTDAQTAALLLGIVGWGAYNGICERLDGINIRLRRIEERLQVLYGLARRHDD